MCASTQLGWLPHHHDVSLLSPILPSAWTHLPLHSRLYHPHCSSTLSLSTTHDCCCCYHRGFQPHDTVKPSFGNESQSKFIPPPAMDSPSINRQNLIHFPVKTHILPPADGINYPDDIEMIEFESLNYTSLKDLIPSSSPLSVASPTSGSWREIPIKDPLVQHAAWAYLQPMAEARDEDDQWWKRLERQCCGLLSCFSEVVWAVLPGWLAQDGDGDDNVD